MESGDNCANELARNAAAARIRPNVELSEISDPDPPHNAASEPEDVAALLGDNGRAKTHSSLDSGARSFARVIYPRRNR